MLVLSLFGCLDPFPTDRHDLVDLRIVGMRRGEAGALDAYVWEGPEAWSAIAPERVWGGDAVCVEAGCTLTAGRDAILTVTGNDGSEEGVLETDAEAGSPILTGHSIAVDGDVATVRVDVPDAERVRWMAPAGTIEELDATSTTFTAPGDGVWPVVALWLDGHGGAGWATIDVPVGVVGFRLAVGTRLLGADATTGGLITTATVEASDDLAGVMLVDVASDDGGVLDPVCGDGAAGWDPNSLVERRCGRDELIGKRVRVSPSVYP